MKTFLPDTSCLVAAVCSWHERHDVVAREVLRRLRGRQEMVLAAHALVETYSVLTRLPSPRRIAPADALAVLRGSFIAHGRIVALDADDTDRLLGEMAAAGVAGGRAYDAVIAASAGKAGVTSLLTLNPRDFEDLVASGVEIVVPG